jgi:hypothetical protein
MTSLLPFPSVLLPVSLSVSLWFRIVVLGDYDDAESR